MPTLAWARAGSLFRSLPPARPEREMNFDPELLARTLAPLVSALTPRPALTPAERMEVLRIAQGFACKDSATAANVSPETVRARRKRIYRKLDVSGANDVIAVLLALSLRALAAGATAATQATASSAVSTGGDASAAGV